MLNAPFEPEEKLLVAVRLVSSYEKSLAAIDVVLSGAESLSQGGLRKVLHPFVSMALGPPPGMHIGGGRPIRLDAAPIRSLFQKKHAEICVKVEALLTDEHPEKVRAAVEIILATDSEELLSRHTRDIFAKLMRRRTLLPGVRRDSSVLCYLREAASNCLERFPEETDEIIQSFLADNDDIARGEANRTYRSVLKHNYREKAQIGAAQKIGFRRLLWAAVESSEDTTDDAGQFFRQSWGGFAPLAVEDSYDLVGAAATLSEKYEQADTKGSLELPDEVLSHLERRNKRTAIDSLQEALIEWAIQTAPNSRSPAQDAPTRFPGGSLH